jgi:hypothetical protein
MKWSSLHFRVKEFATTFLYRNDNNVIVKIKYNDKIFNRIKLRSLLIR